MVEYFLHQDFDSNKGSGHQWETKYLWKKIKHQEIHFKNHKTCNLKRKNCVTTCNKKSFRFVYVHDHRWVVWWQRDILNESKVVWKFLHGQIILLKYLKGSVNICYALCPMELSFFIFLLNNFCFLATFLFCIIIH